MEKIDLAKVRYPGERWSFVVLLGLALIFFLLAIVSVFGVIWLGLFILFQVLFHQITMAYFRANSVKVGPNQYPVLNQLAEIYCERLGLDKMPDLFVIQQTTLNAFATRVARRYVVVIYSHTVETMLEDKRADALGMVIAHEFGHVAAKHLKWGPLISSVGIFFPLVYLKWSRCCEYTADRLAYLCLDDKSGALEGLLKLMVGKQMATMTNLQALEEQYARLQKDRWAKISEAWSTHPHLLNRIHKLDYFAWSLKIANTRVAVEEVVV